MHAHPTLETTALQDEVFLRIFDVLCLESNNQHPNLLCPFHNDASSHLLVTYLSTSTFRGFCPGSRLKGICTLGLNDCTGKSDSVRSSVVGPTICLSRILFKFAGVLNFVAKRQRETHLKPPGITFLYIHTQKMTLLSTGLSAEVTSLDLWEKSSRHQIRNRKKDLFSLWQYVIMVFQYQTDGIEETSTENYCHAGFWEPGHWPGSKELCFVSSFATDSLHDSEQVTVSSAQLPSPSERDGILLPLWGPWDQESVTDGRNLVKMVIKGLWILQGKRSCRPPLKVVSVSSSAYSHLGTNLSLLSFCSIKPPTHISNGVRKNWVKQPTISPFGKSFLTEIWTKKKYAFPRTGLN